MNLYKNKSLIVGISIQVTSADLLNFYALLSGLGKPQPDVAEINAANGGDAGGLVDPKTGALLNVGALLGKKDTCIAKCPTKITDADMQCVTPTFFETTMTCWGPNTDGKNIWPCFQVEKNKPAGGQ